MRAFDRLGKSVHQNPTLYHGTSVVNACSILESDELYHEGSIDSDGEHFLGVSFTRSASVAAQFGPVLLSFDRENLSRRY